MTILDSIYAHETGARKINPQLDSDLVCDVAIIGGGLTGVSTALTLAKRGYDVALCEAHSLGTGGSGRNGGHVCQGWPNDFHHISRQISPSDADLAWHAGMSAVDLLTQNVADYDIDCDLRFGYLHAALHKGQMRDLDIMQAEWEARGYNHFTRLDNPNALAKHIGSDAYVGALHDSGCGHIQPLKYLLGLATAAQAAGARIYENTPITKLVTKPEKILTTADGKTIQPRIIVLCGNAYLGDLALPHMRRRLAQVTSSILATKPLSDNMIKALLPTGAAVSDCNAALNYYRIDASGRMIFGGRASYTNVQVGNLERDLRRRMEAVFPMLAGADIEQIWSGKIGITVNRIPHFGRTNDDVYFVQGFSGHGVALTGQAGHIIADAISGNGAVFDVMTQLNHLPFPGGVFRTPALALGMAWYKLRDQLKF
ncbi:NAD(P)/FAD-dependent oxidoreductase [Candidatus Puniceispirillum sp.]|uniref:NAD(P)/FAD-dependent oxidoreductase n=1 Tax=Candidatus Puniceispirillum sp. TaxID=2026719 RepID=UPI003F694E4D